MRTINIYTIIIIANKANAGTVSSLGIVANSGDEHEVIANESYDDEMDMRDEDPTVIPSSRAFMADKVACDQ